MHCPACGAVVAATARFCEQCGARLPSEPIARPASGTGGDRRVVTALFADLVDYVRLVAEHDPEVVRRRVGAALAAMSEAIDAFDGTREKFIGDAVFAVFGWPSAHRDATLRATLRPGVRTASPGSRIPGAGRAQVGSGWRPARSSPHHERFRATWTGR